MCLGTLLAAAADSVEAATDGVGASLRIAATTAPADEIIGRQPDEIVRANRKPKRSPLVEFDSLEGWSVECLGGATAKLYSSREQRVWDSKTAKLTCRGMREKGTLIVRPSAPIPIDAPFDCVNLWLHGDKWVYSREPSAPKLHVSLLVADGAGREHEIPLTRVRWMFWWLVHHRFDAKMINQLGPQSRFTGLKVTGSANADDRVLFFEDLAFYREKLAPLEFAPRPKRGIDPFPGQSPGANTGRGRLPFPTREQTILPTNLEARYSNQVTGQPDGSFRFVYRGLDALLEYVLYPGQADLGRVDVILNGDHVATGLVGAGLEWETPPEQPRLVQATLNEGVVRLVWDSGAESHLRLWQKSLVVDFFCPGGNAKKLDYGKITGVVDPEIIRLPNMNYHAHPLGVLIITGKQNAFASLWMDWYRSNASRPFARDEITSNEVFLNGGVEYRPKTDGKRNDVFERFFFTVSPIFEETLATIPNPPAAQGRQAGLRLWQESWGPHSYEKEMRRSRRLRAYGIVMLTQCNHEITWRDGGESFTFKDRAATGMGGDQGLRKYVEHQRRLGWRSGLYTNYCDLTSFSTYWDEDHVMRQPDGDWMTAYLRCYSVKTSVALAAAAELAPKIRDKFGTDAAYTDVHTAVSPWGRTDYDARVPGAGTFASTFYAYGELLLAEQTTYDGFCWSEGNHRWLYAGLATGNYGLTNRKVKLRTYPYLPHFDLLKIHPLEVDVGMPWTDQFHEGNEGWGATDRIEHGIDQFLAASIAYGRIGWLVEERYGIRQTCRSYYMLQQLQSRYVMRAPTEILYGTMMGLVSSSQALAEGHWRNSRLFVRYPGPLRIWVNGNTEKNWSVKVDGTSLLLPPSGWVAVADDFFEVSALAGGRRVDHLVSPAYVYVDGRGQPTDFVGIRTEGALAVRPADDGKGLSLVAVAGVEQIRINEPAGPRARGPVCAAISAVVRSESLVVEAFDIEGESLGPAVAARSRHGWSVTPVANATRYEMRSQ
jgi:hypothetical protein